MGNNYFKYIAFIIKIRRVDYRQFNIINSFICIVIVKGVFW